MALSSQSLFGLDIFIIVDSVANYHFFENKNQLLYWIEFQSEIKNTTKTTNQTKKPTKFLNLQLQQKKLGNFNFKKRYKISYIYIFTDW